MYTLGWVFSWSRNFILVLLLQQIFKCKVSLELLMIIFVLFLSQYSLEHHSWNDYENVAQFYPFHVETVFSVVFVRIVSDETEWERESCNLTTVDTFSRLNLVKSSCTVDENFLWLLPRNSRVSRAQNLATKRRIILCPRDGSIPYNLNKCKTILFLTI